METNRALKELDKIFLCLGLSYDRSSKKDRIKRRCIYIFNIIWHNSDVFGALVWFYVALQNGASFIELTYIAPCLAFSFLANFRIYSVISNEEKVYELITTLRELEHRAMDDTDITEIFREDTKFLHKVLKMSKVLNFTLIFTFFITPLILTLVKYLNTGKWDLLLPFLIIYPFDSHDIRYWPFVYLHQLWSEVIAILEICSTDNLFYICCMFIRIQFRILQTKFSKINIHRSLNADYFKLEFTELVIWHQRLIRSLKILDQIYSKSTLLYFLTSSIIICLTGFNVMSMGDKAFTSMFLTFLLTSLLQIFFICFFGDLVMQSSSGVSYAMYSSKWYKADVKFRKLCNIVQTRAQIASKLTAYGFADVNLRAFMSILSTAWSYFALLKTLYNPS
ncbi:putative odorant receptor 92a [Pieris rapae]|uniref:putative odorant receptor 92a n=1 Tax=Pieris rapae TaxID=64459 RepID=UPI001E2809FA|nr:putative odorant receptor 92a [Pieris rapae]